MPVLGISPCRILCDLPVYDFQGYPLGIDDLVFVTHGCTWQKVLPSLRIKPCFFEPAHDRMDIESLNQLIEEKREHD